MIKNIMIAMLSVSLVLGGYLADKKIALLETAIATQQLKHKKDILKTKIKERGKRLLIAIPIAGAFALGWFEKREYDEWKEDHPDGDFQVYTNEVLDAASEVAQDMAMSYCADIGIDCQELQAKLVELMK